jgi:glycerol-3-phosphate acyltransferase PlsY
MIVNEVVTGIVVVVIAYLLGSIPSAYIFAKLLTGKDIRGVSGGNVGTRNVFLNAGKTAGVLTAFFDIAKGTGAVVFAYSLLGAPDLLDTQPDTLFVFTAGLAAIAGHIWPIYLKFEGGNGLATVLGVTVFLMPREAAIAIGFTILLWALSRNVVLAFNTSLFSLPVSGWFLTHSWTYVLYPIAMVVVMLLNFFPVMAADIKRAKDDREFFRQLFRRKKAADS